MSLVDRLELIENRIKEACQRSGRNRSDVTLLCVSKAQPLQSMLELFELYRAKGSQPVFGENYVQEFKEKRPCLPVNTRVHMIGALQRNKAKDAIALFDCIESVHSEPLAVELNKYAQKAGLVKDILLQVNVSADPQKSGFSPDAVLEFVPRLAQLPALRFCGLMTITALYDNPADARPDFGALAQLKQRLLPLLTCPPVRFELSMGMSSDYEIAIEEGATIVRVGSALFGERQ